MVLAMFSNAVTKVFGSRNERLVKSYNNRVAQVGSLETQARSLTDSQLKAKTHELRDRHRNGEKYAALLPEALAVAREAMDRSVGIRNIFNPEHNFDPAQLPPDARTLYDQVQAQITQLQPTTVLGNNQVPVPPWMQVEIPIELYEAVRKLFPLSRPPFRARPFDVQLIGGMVLSEGKISEMKTGEGKTIVAPLACYLACVENLQCHVVTVNDYLVQRDRDWVFPFYYHLGLTVGAIHPYHMQSTELKQQAYQCDVVYGTNSEFGFDYLRDNMKLDVSEQVQKRREFCIIDEVDSILIDEARTPLIISGQAHDDSPRYELADNLARHLIQKQRQWDAADQKVQQTITRIRGLEGDIRNARDKDAIPAMRQEMERLQKELPGLEQARDQNTRYYEVEPEKKASHLTHQGVAEAQKQADIGSFYVGANMDVPHLLENALRAHAVYQRDKAYVVREGEVVIVDEYTGRLMIGRQWSDGLHQAVEAKEKVKIKQETQTLATVTIQNFFKLYKRLAGMTGTALTEATEFHDIYKLDVVSIPTNVPVIRNDLNDLIFTSEKDKWNAILDEIKRMHDVGRPVLVGTTSVENSEMLSGMLTKKHGVKHEVLNAKQHEREAHIVAHAGQLGAVMIATNMAGRGTDIRLTPIDRAAIVRHWQLRNLLPREAKPEMPDQELADLSYRHQAKILLGKQNPSIDKMTGDQAQLALLRLWVTENTFTDPDKAARMSAEDCRATLDKVPGFLAHRLRVYQHIEEMGGLHIVGTERHESRRIDNQLRGRAGRQGDRGSSRFFISLEDELMKLFAGKKTLALLSKFGMKEGDAIEHPMITRSVERAQRKVEERNYEIRKNLLEYDEVMEYQRRNFYGLRQDVLEGNKIETIVFDYISDSVADAVVYFLDPDYVPSQIAQWCHQQLDVLIEPFRLRETDPTRLQKDARDAARDDIRQTIELTIGEYMPTEDDDGKKHEGDLRGLSSWAMSRFSVDVKQNQLRQMTIDQVKNTLTDAALVQLDRKDLSGLAKFLQPHYAQKDLAHWAAQKFAVELDPAQLAALPAEEIRPHVLEKARAAYRKREIDVPVEWILEGAFSAARQNSQWAAEQLCAWANQRYELGWTPETIARMTGNELKDKLIAAARDWVEGDKLKHTVDHALQQHSGDLKALSQWAGERFSARLDLEKIPDVPARTAALLDAGRAMLRSELTRLERIVLLQILDTAWKDHLYAIDQLKDSIGLRSYAERDPRIEYKKEGANLFALMQRAVRDHVTELIFRVKFSADAHARNVYTAQHAQHADPGSALGHAAAPGDQQPAPGPDDADQQLSRRARRAAASRDQRDDPNKRPGFKERKRRRR